MSRGTLVLPNGAVRGGGVGGPAGGLALGCAYFQVDGECLPERMLKICGNFGHLWKWNPEGRHTELSR